MEHQSKLNLAEQDRTRNGRQLNHRNLQTKRLWLYGESIHYPLYTHVSHTMEPASLTSLPDDLLLDIVEYLDTARDTSHLGRVAKHTHRLVQQAGWKTFVKTRFPSLRVPHGNGCSWSDAADTISYLDRCWDKRAIQLSLFRTQPRPRTKDAPRQPRQAIDFHGIVDAHYMPSLDEEVVAWGAGEDLHVRWGRDATQTWKSVLGASTSTKYAPGTGDATCLSIIERRAGLPEVVVGRANGDVQVLSAANNKSFGQPTQTVIKLDGRQDAHQQTPFSISPGRLAVSCTEWQPDTDMLATCRSSHLHLYNIPPERDADPKPLAYHDLSKDRPGNEESLIRDIKFLGRTSIAVALGASSQPIQYGTIRPTGVDFVPASRNPDACDSLDGRLELTAPGEVTSVWSIQAVGHRANSNLLLSSWHDGSFRLMDVRTPSPYDAIYRDNFQPYHAGGPLLVYGTERFVSGNNTAPTLRLFDFRFPKPYFHSTALPCSPREPRPRVACSSGKPLDDRTAVWRCEPGSSRRCNWHAAMESPCFRQDTTLWLGHRGMDRVFSLAKASDTSDKFYLGLRGAIAEAQLVLEQDVPARRQSAPRCPPGWRVSAAPNAAMADTGISLSTSSVHGGTHGDLHNGMPEMLYHYDGSQGKQGLRELLEPPEGTRFDTAWRQQVAARHRGHSSREL